MTKRTFRSRFADRDGSGERDELVHGGEADQDVDDPRKDSFLTTEQRGYKVELKEADEKPTDATDDDQQKGDEVERVHFFFLCVLIIDPTLLRLARSTGTAQSFVIFTGARAA